MQQPMAITWKYLESQSEAPLEIAVDRKWMKFLDIFVDSPDSKGCKTLGMTWNDVAASRWKMENRKESTTEVWILLDNIVINSDQ